ncbi:hypothetical protein GCM10011575_13010 [Microlunatus endophyticus]|uniref:Uncharacterized protein n=1 Tax=Microlunatus endophyticus TaxID=1716077 RepID=A0A917S5E7_9ACTN|nr:hypothetical protein [Microlunatus endophyticus]GGL56032.1 hypothetical protein GCM10011575_13010 [Microlunatus endophyticus]
MADEGAAYVMAICFAGPDGAAQGDRFDDHIAKLPGMAGLMIVRDAFASRRIALKTG